MPTFRSFQDLDKALSQDKGKKKKKKKQLRAAAGQQQQEAAPEKPPQPPTDEDAFLAAMTGVQPMEGQDRRLAPPPKKTPAALREDCSGEDVAAHLMDLVNGKVEFTLEFTDEFIQGRVAGLDPAVATRLKSGRYSPEAHLDMHGMTAREGYDAMVFFLKDAYMQNRRCVLLIPGRGKNSPDGYGVLRQKVQSWLTRDPFKRVVLAFCTALPKHGGAGALYVLLRNYKKSRGKIYWDRAPDDPDLYT